MKMRHHQFFALILALGTFLSENILAHEFSNYGANDSAQISLGVGLNQFGLAIMANGEPAACYISTANNNTLSYADANDDWIAEEIEANLSGNDECTLIFQQDIPHIFYSDFTNNQLKHATKENDVWVLNVIDANFNQNVDDITMSRRLSAALSPDGSRLAVAYHDGDVKDLKYAEYINDAWNTETLVDDGDQGEWPTLIFTQANTPIIAFAKNWGTDAELWLIEEVNGNWAAAEQFDADGDDVGSYTSLAIDGNDRLHLAYKAQTGDIKELRYTYRENGEWNETIEVSDHTTDFMNARFVRMAVDAQGYAFFLYNWDFASAINLDSSEMEIKSLYFIPEHGWQNYTSFADTVDIIMMFVTQYYEAALVMDSNYNTYAAWVVNAGLNNRSLEIKKLSSWRPAALFLNPNEQENVPDENNQFTFRWLDFDPDSNAYLRFDWRIGAGNYNPIGDVLREDDVNEATLTLDDLPGGDIPIYLELSDSADFALSSYYGASSNLTVLEEEEEVVVEEEEEVAEDDEAEGNDDQVDDADPQDNNDQADGDSPDDEQQQGDDGDDTSNSGQQNVLATASAGGCQLQPSGSTQPLALANAVFFLSCWIVTQKRFSKI